MVRPAITYASTPRQAQVLFGEDGMGKTRAALSLAVAFPQQTTYILSPQDGEGWIEQQFGGLPNLVRLPVRNFADIRGWMRGVTALPKVDKDQLTISDPAWTGLRGVVQPGDTVVLDMIDEQAETFLRDYYCLRFHGKTLADMMLAAGAKAKKGVYLEIFRESDPDAWQKMKAVADDSYRWLFNNERLNVFMTCQATDVAVDVRGDPVYKVAPEYVRLGQQPHFPDVVRYGVNNVVYLNRKGEKWQAQLVRKNRIQGNVVDTKPFEVGPVYWYSFCEKVGIDPTQVPGL